MACKGPFLIQQQDSIVRRGVQSPTWKNITQVPAKLSDLPKIKCPVHSHLEYMLQKVFKMTGVKLTICRVSLIGIYWYQSTNRFINSHLFMHSHKGGSEHRSYDLYYDQIRKLHLKLHLKKITSKLYAKSWNSN